MQATEYREAREISGIALPDVWERAIGVSADMNKSYSSGRTTVPPDVAFRVTSLVDRIQKGSKALSAALQHNLPACAVAVAARPLRIVIRTPSGKALEIHNKGVDSLNGWLIYGVDSRNATVFLHAPDNLWGRSTQKPSWNWTLWRGSFAENRNAGHFQNYPNQLSESLLREALAQWLV